MSAGSTLPVRLRALGGEGLTRLFVHRQSGKSIKEKRADKQAKHTDTPPLGIVPVKRK